MDEKTVVIEREKRLKRLNLENGKEVGLIEGRYPFTYSSNGGSLLYIEDVFVDEAATGGNRIYKEETLKVKNVMTGEDIQTLVGHNGSFDVLALSPDGRYAAAGWSISI
jgi:WD40 repeat protein